MWRRDAAPGMGGGVVVTGVVVVVVVVGGVVAGVGDGDIVDIGGVDGIGGGGGL